MAQPGELAEQHSIVPFAQPTKFLDVAMIDPTNIGIVDELTIRTKLNIRPYLAGPKMVERTITKYYGKRFVRAMRRPDFAISFDTGDVIDDATAVPKRDRLRRFPRGHIPPLASPPPSVRDAEIAALQECILALEALVARDEQVLRKLLALLVEMNVATRDEIVDRLG